MPDTPTPDASSPEPQPPSSSQPDEALLRQVLADVQQLKAAHGWRSGPQRRMAYLLGEVIELAEEVLQLGTASSGAEGDRQRIGREIYDVLWNACDLAQLAGIDLPAAAADKRQFNASRVWRDPKGGPGAGQVARRRTSDAPRAEPSAPRAEPASDAPKAKPAFDAPKAKPASSSLDSPLLQKVDAVTVPVPDLDAGLSFYRDALGHQLAWRNEEVGQAGLRLPGSETELVLTTREDYAPSWLVESADRAARAVRAAGGRVVGEPADIPVGRVAVVTDPFGNALVLLDLSKGRYTTDAAGQVTGVVTERDA
jgi:NTP pyrophosphatase (non-canonical NTP hydrolase)/predicted enzyme related to lactoylglutathione lyase